MSASADDLALFGSDEPEAPAPKTQASDDDIAMFSKPSGPSAFMAGRGGGFDDDDQLAPTWKPVVNAGPRSPKNADGTYVNWKYNNDPAEQFKAQKTVAALGDVAKHPIQDLVTDPSKRRELVRGVSDVATFGLAERAGNAASNSSWLKAHGFDFGPNLASTAQTDAENAPGYRGVGELGGMVLPNPAGEVAGVVVKGSAAAAGRAIDVAAKPVAKAVEKFAKGSESREVGRAVDKTIQGGRARTRAGLEHAEEKLIQVMEENKSVKIAALKGDKYLASEGERLGKRGSQELSGIYKESDLNSAIDPSRAEAQITGDLHDLPGAAKTSTPAEAEGPALLTAADDTSPVVFDSARAYHLDQNAIAAETRAAKAEAAIARDEARGVPVNPELRAKFDRRAAIKEVAARELRDRADNLRAIADEAKAKNVPPGGKTSMPEGVEYIPPKKGSAEAPTEPPVIDAKVKTPVSRPPGADLGDVVKNMDASIKRMSKPTSAGGTTESRAVAEKLQQIRDKFVLENQGGARYSPSEFLRREQTAYQKKGYGKAMAGDEAATAMIAANREASKAVGDVIVKHVTGMDYATAKAAAAADPTSVAGRLFKANRDVEISNLIEAHMRAKKGLNPEWARNLLHAAKGMAHASGAGLIGGLAHTGHGALATAAGIVHAGVTAAPYVVRGADAAATAVAPFASKVAKGGVATEAMQGLAVPIAKLLRAARAGGISRKQLEAMAQEQGVPPDVADKIAVAHGLPSDENPGTEREKLAMEALSDPAATARERARARQIVGGP